jgi:tartrate dehydrogenase/decarboxylase/D-malate dehydrogenase
MKTYNIASIEGDGIGKEVVPEAHKVLKKLLNIISLNC